jgi:hypothetical protein
MAPKWFNIETIPYNEMWPDDIHWLPKVLAGKKIFGNFIFDEKQNLTYFAVDELKGN